MTDASHFEAKKHAYRQTQDGIVVSFVVHPNDVSAALAMAPLGTRFMVALAEIGDDEKPVTNDDEHTSAQRASPSDGDGISVATVLARTVEDSGHSIISTSALSEEIDALPNRSTKPRKSFSEYPLSAQAGMRCREPQFRRFLATKDGPSDFAMFDLDMAEDEVRDFCGVKSRADLDRHPGGALRWRELETQFQSWLATQMHAEHYR